VYEVNAHTNEVDDLHISCDGKQVTYNYVELCFTFFEYSCIFVSFVLREVEAVSGC